MDTQNTPVHIRLWNRDFWLLVIADMLVATGVYMQMLYLPIWAESFNSHVDTRAWMMGGYALGLYGMGGFCSYWVQKYRRNRVCLQSLVVLAALLMAPVLFSSFFQANEVWALPLLRFATGAFYGLVQMVMTSTLVIDCCEARQRTEANYATAWFYRFALSLGPLTALVVLRHAGFPITVWCSVGLVLLAFVLISLVRFPFKTPEENVRLFSLDRFLLPRAWVLFIQLLVITIVLGLVVSVFFTHRSFFAWLMLGFLLALLAEKFVFVNAELKSETVSGLLLMGAAVLLMLAGESRDVLFIAPVLIGLGSGIIGSRFLLFFIKLSEHCRRGTSQSTYFLAWESGIALGLCLGFSIIGDAKPGSNPYSLIGIVALLLIVFALVLYLGFSHKWYINHKNR